MNLYDLHPHPETLSFYNRRFELPFVAYDEAWKRYCVLYTNAQKRGERISEITYSDLEPGIAKSAEHAVLYAFYILHTRFPLGEPTISQNYRSKRTYEQHFQIKL